MPMLRSPSQPTPAPKDGRWSIRLVLVSAKDPSADLEIFFGLVALIVLAALLLLPLEMMLGWLGRCRFHQLTGQPCMSCGLTRGVIALSSGRLLEALALNPLFIGGLLLVLGYGPIAALSWLAGWRRLRVRVPGRWARGFMALLAVGALVANWVYLVCAGI